ncbi:LytR/AlgR family response regulator transcription factor [Flectobacillus roseus]|uniref:LytTR family transcriptional regulator DNA-binding domain-containing protein n=1 Tax=Flectobacillus roseus TaxID=502259 RepID=A0ABT6Y5Y5_9BACT|nr:LytTR family DNA-binding domain-containing protein [Flectobacillus roseus]MDI9858989.1 LytTR family transcriptional regulator DNA-binding domain-containing protein [Flectobacillus roseus]
MKSIKYNNQSYKVMVVDDDHESSLLIESILNQENFTHVGSVRKIADLDLVYDVNKPDLIISKLSMENVDLYKLLIQEKFNSVPVLFIVDWIDTKNMIQEKERSKSLFLAKPLLKLTLKSSIHLLLSAYPPQITRYVEVLSKNLQKLKINCEEIVYIEADGNYTSIHTIHKKVFVRKKSLVKVKRELTSYFLQINRSQIINTNFIRRLILGKGILILNDTEIKIGRAYRMCLDEYLQNDRS